jgi:hypothetical protein
MQPSTKAAYVYIDSFWTSAQHALTIRASVQLHARFSLVTSSSAPTSTVVDLNFLALTRRFKQDNQLEKAAPDGRVNT